MARFDVYAHPVAAMRKRTPYLVDVQNEFISGLDTRMVIPARPASLVEARMSDLHPVVDIQGGPVVLDTPAMAAFPARELTRRVASLQAQQQEIIAAIDCLLGAF